ncbi:MAG: phosphoribosylaminoimidazolesuccinocarboxamide synthase [Bacteroidia bacterium]|nr:MAG: phosphoribosylaminoimidazolesuccinocarboxamide synthase [Bacteroidia bacterium]
MNLNPITSLKKIYAGKVRDLYKIDDDTMLMVATDRLSTFDVIMNQEIPNKGIILTQISLFWFNLMKDIIKNHLLPIPLSSILKNKELAYAENRAIIVKKLQPIPIEVIIRGYLSGSGYKDYLQTGAISGIKLPSGLKNNAKLPNPIFTPSSKAQIGDHDENITIMECKNHIGSELTDKIASIALKIFATASEYANKCGIIIADTKLEFGLDHEHNLVLMDEVLTPDSSRFWDLNTYEADNIMQSFDKQFIRDYLELDIKWNKLPPIPDIPEVIIQQTQAKYQELLNRITK